MSMVGSKFSEDQQLLIAGYILQTLDSEEADAFEQLMMANSAVTQEVEQLQKTLEVAYGPPQVQPPAHLRASVMNSFQAANSDLIPQASSASQSLSHPRTRRSHPWGWPVGWKSIAALLIVGLSLSNVFLWRKLQTIQAQQAGSLLTVSLQPTRSRVTTAAVTTTAEVVIDPANLEAVLKLKNLPPLPDGQVYVLWTVLKPNAPFTTDRKNAILTEAFTVEKKNQSKQIVLPPVYREQQWIKAIAITVEAANAPQRHLSSPILLEAL